MQLTIGQKLMVYDLRPTELSEISMIDIENNDYDTPITFSHTGFLFNTAKKTFDTNLSASIGVERPC